MEFKRLEKSKDVSSVFDKLQQSAANQATGSKYENLFLNSGNSGSNARGSMVRNLLKMKASVFMKKIIQSSNATFSLSFYQILKTQT